MPDAKARRVLLCGGYLDGRWVDVPEGSYVYRVPPAPVRFTHVSEPEADLHVPIDDFVEYLLRPFELRIGEAGGRLWIGVCDWDFDRDRAVLRALLQRDVAQQLLGGR